VPFLARISTLLRCVAAVSAVGGTLLAEEPLRLYTSPALGQVVAAALPGIRAAGIEARMKGEASSTIALQLLAGGEADAVFTVRPMTGEDRAEAPELPFLEVPLAVQATAVIVSREVWESGVRAVTKEQLRQIYEREITDWSQLGGLKREIKFFNYERGQGVWEQFVQWIYGEIRRAPLGKWEIVVSGEDAHNTVQFNGGGISIAPPRWADGRDVFALAIRDEAGAPVEPTRAHLLDRTYPLSRPVLLVFGDKPTGLRLRLRDYLLTPAAQQLFFKSGLIPITETAPEPAAP
jgi:phosphate transport system substrate-binding protein